MTLVIVLLLSAMFAQGADSRTSVRVLVFTSTSARAEHTAEEQGRVDAVGEVKDALRGKKGITLVENRSEANVFVEVVGREQREEPGGAFGGKTITRMGDTIIRLHVTSGSEESELKGIGRGTWGRAAKDAADRLMKWIARREPRRGS
jgi:hypothetical protein